ncbi:MAG TPA: PQQ-binding-like beta-propeller repeat protein [Gammaproteobacteria bacterium]|nr:PQQ-binding-like beta-propeller repeat protein [Gammaproteobacteria bacterium]
MSNLERYPVIDDKTKSAYIVYMKHPGDPRPQNAALFAHDLSQNGVVRWEVPLQNLNTNPVVAGSEIYSTQYDNTKLNAVNAVTGKILWTWSPENDLINPDYPQLATNDVIFVVGNQKTYAVSRTTHQTVWETNRVGKIAIGDGKLLIHSMQDGSFDHVTAYLLT